MRFKRRADEKLLGEYLRNLYLLGLVRKNQLGDQVDAFNAPIHDGTYSLTRKYYRYCAYRRDRFFHGTIWPVIVSAVVSATYPHFVSHVLPVIIDFFTG